MYKLNFYFYIFCVLQKTIKKRFYLLHRYFVHFQIIGSWFDCHTLAMVINGALKCHLFDLWQSCRRNYFSWSLVDASFVIIEWAFIRLKQSISYNYQSCLLTSYVTLCVNLIQMGNLQFSFGFHCRQFNINSDVNVSLEDESELSSDWMKLNETINFL